MYISCTLERDTQLGDACALVVTSVRLVLGLWAVGTVRRLPSLFVLPRRVLPPRSASLTPSSAARCK